MYPVNRLLSNQAFRFILVGISTVLIDLLIYFYLINIEFPPLFSKAVSFVAGSVYAYQANRVWTFSAGKPNFVQLFRFYLVYSTSLILNVLSNSILLSIFVIKSYFNTLISFIIATLISATTNYLLLKTIVFRVKSKKPKTSI